MRKTRIKQDRLAAARAPRDEAAAIEAVKKNKGILAGTLRNKILSGLMLLLIAAAIASCDIDGGGIEPNSPTTPTSPNNPTNPTNPNAPTSYHDFPNFNPADYPILNESGKSDSAIADLKDLIWLMYAEREDIGEWTANYIKSNKIKTILSNDQGAHGWIWPDQLDRIYISEYNYSVRFEGYNDSQYNDSDRANIRENGFKFFTHETMHLVQYKSNAFNLMKGMRPDICAAVDMLTEYLAWFYTENRYQGTDITAGMPNAVEIQSQYMIWSIDPWGNDNIDGKDPSRPPYIHSTPWFNNDLSAYAYHAFVVGLVRENAMTAPLREASKEDMLKVCRAMLACRDPNKAGVTDEALWTVFDALCQAAVGNSKYLQIGKKGLSQESFDNFQEFIAEWDAAYAAQARSVVQTRTRGVTVTGLAAAIVW
jgi:hypothetical protein